jgi:FKBP-type peptidyl-prolyl cis-trans isomerase
VILYGVTIAGDFQAASLVNPGRPLKKGERETMTVKIGEKIGEYKLAKIQPDRITMESNGDSFEVLLYDSRNPKKRMEVNKKKEGVKTLPSGLQYKVLMEGSGKTPKAANEVTVNYRGIFIDGTEFDSTYKRGKPGTFQVDRVIRGWTEALQLMKEGSKWQLFILPDLGYGDRGAGPIPPNGALIFEVELISVK